jgi:hypothetical protein
MAALAFTAYGVHWFAIGMGRSFRGDPEPSAFMCIAFASISVARITGISSDPITRIPHLG